MKNKLIYILFISFLFTQDQIGTGLNTQDLINLSPIIENPDDIPVEQDSVNGKNLRDLVKFVFEITLLL